MASGDGKVGDNALKLRCLRLVERDLQSCADERLVGSVIEPIRARLYRLASGQDMPADSRRAVARRIGELYHEDGQDQFVRAFLLSCSLLFADDDWDVLEGFLGIRLQQCFGALACLGGMDMQYEDALCDVMCAAVDSARSRLDKAADVADDVRRCSSALLDVSRNIIDLSRQPSETEEAGDDSWVTAFMVTFSAAIDLADVDVDFNEVVSRLPSDQ